MEQFGTSIVVIDDPHADVDALVSRARALLGFMDSDSAINTLIESGVNAGEAFLAVTAAGML